MSYETIAQWAVDAYPPKMFNSYSEWHAEVERDFLSSNHFFPSNKVDPLLEKQWLRFHDRLEPEREQEPVEDERPEARNVGQRISRTLERLPSDTEFTPAQMAKFTGLNKNTVRRELPEFVASGELQRVRRGVYRIV